MSSAAATPSSTSPALGNVSDALIVNAVRGRRVQVVVRLLLMVFVVLVVALSPPARFDVTCIVIAVVRRILGVNDDPGLTT